MKFTDKNTSIGLGLAQAYAARPNYTVIVAVRTPSSCPKIEAVQGSEVLVVKCDAGSPEDPKKVDQSRYCGEYRLTGVDGGRVEKRTWHREA